MIETIVRSQTARRLWALPGATLTGFRVPKFVNGAVVVTESSPLMPMPCPSFLIEHPRGLVLFDTGVSPKAVQEPEKYARGHSYTLNIERELLIDAQLAGLGIKTEQIKYVIASHLHFDHAGALYLFPKATFFLGAGEWQHTFAPQAGAEINAHLEDVMHTRGFNWFQVPGDHDLFGDGSIQLLHTPGHTPGELSLLVRLPNRVMILTGDTCHYRVELEHGVPYRPFVRDAAEAAQSIRRLRLFRDAYDAEVWVAHDVDDWAKLPHAPQSLE